jgi:protein phosphatase 1 regulatory subunit 7
MEKENQPPEDELNGGENPHQSPKDSKGWDGKLRVDRKPVLANPEAISDPEYSDDEHVVQGEEIAADEGIFHQCPSLSEVYTKLLLHQIFWTTTQ